MPLYVYLLRMRFWDRCGLPICFLQKGGRCGYELNAVFQGALACAKKIKTETLLSKTSVSVATLACAEIFGLKSSEAERRTVRIRIRGSFRCCSSAAAGRWAEAC